MSPNDFDTFEVKTTYRGMCIMYTSVVKSFVRFAMR